MDEPRYIPPWAFFILGGAIFIAAFVVWVLTHTQSELFVGAAMTLMGAGAAQKWRIKIEGTPQLPIMPPPLTLPTEVVKEPGDGKMVDGV